MKNLRRFFAAATLTLALTLSALAGDMGAPGAINPPPPPSGDSAVSSIEVTGTPATTNALTSGEVTLDPLTEITLSLIEGVRSIF